MDCRVKPGNDEMCVARLCAIISPELQLSNSRAGSPVLFEAPGTPWSSSPWPNKARGAERRAAHLLETASRRGDAARALAKARTPLGAPPWRFLAVGTVLPAARQ